MGQLLPAVTATAVSARRWCAVAHTSLALCCPRVVLIGVAEGWLVSLCLRGCGVRDSVVRVWHLVMRAEAQRALLGAARRGASATLR